MRQRVLAASAAGARSAAAWRSISSSGGERSVSSSGDLQQQGSPAAAVLPLVREFIHDALYNTQSGYFAQRTSPVGLGLVGGRPLDFGSLWGREGYLQALHQLYQEQQVAWMTPSEVFSPTYGRGVANYLLQHHARRGGRGPLHIVECGGGNGTLARDVLDFLRGAEPNVYRRCRYTSLEISEELARRQLENVVSSGGHTAAYSVRRGDACAASGWGPLSRDFTYVLMCEVMDNMPHDRVVRPVGGGEWLQTHVTSGHEEVVAPLQDSLLRDCLAVFGEQGEVRQPLLQRLMRRALEGDTVQWLPTGALQCLRALFHARPHNQLICADFDALPEVQVQGMNAPLVATTAGGKTTDHATYLVPPGSADIFFPVDFGLSARLYAAAARDATGDAAPQVTTQVLKSREFFETYANVGQTACSGGGYNPLLEDFSNTSFLLASTQEDMNSTL